MVVQKTVYFIVAVTLIILAVLVVINSKLKKYDPLTKPSGLIALVIMAVQMVDGMVRDATNEKITKHLAPYIASVFIYILIANISGLIGFESPTMNFSVTLTLAIITVVTVETLSIKYTGIKQYVSDIMYPIVPFAVINLVGKISPLISLSMRLFANVLSGSVIMQLLYSATGLLSGLLPVVGQFNFMGVVVAPIFHAYFDLISGLLQAFLFMSLSIAYIGNGLPAESKN